MKSCNDGFIFYQVHGTFNYMFQFPYVSRPIVCIEKFTYIYIYIGYVEHELSIIFLIKC